MNVLKKWVLMPLGYVAFLAPLLQLLVSYTLGILYGNEIKYLAVNTFTPWLVSTAVCIALVFTVSRADAELLFVYSLVTLIVISLCSSRMGEVDGVFTVSGWKSFEYTPVERMLEVPYGDQKLTFPSLRKFENGGYIMVKSTETGMFSKYYACPAQVETVSCIEVDG